jgi:hypothetical protein
VLHGQRGGSPTVVNLSFLDRTLKAILQIKQLHLESGKQIVWQVPSQSPVVRLLLVVWEYTEASTVLRAGV